MIKHFDTLDAAKLALETGGYKEIQPGVWAKEGFKATIHPSPSSVAVFWSIQ